MGHKTKSRLKVICLEFSDGSECECYPIKADLRLQQLRRIKKDESIQVLSRNDITSEMGGSKPRPIFILMLGPQGPTKLVDLAGDPTT